MNRPSYNSEGHCPDGESPPNHIFPDDLHGDEPTPSNNPPYLEQESFDYRPSNYAEDMLDQVQYPPQIPIQYGFDAAGPSSYATSFPSLPHPPPSFPTLPIFPEDLGFSGYSQYKGTNIPSNSRTSGLGLDILGLGGDLTPVQSAHDVTADRNEVPEGGVFFMPTEAGSASIPHPWANEPRKHPLVQSGKAYICFLGACSSPGTVIIKKERNNHNSVNHGIPEPRPSKGNRKDRRNERLKQRAPYHTDRLSPSEEQAGPSTYFADS